MGFNLQVNPNQMGTDPAHLDNAGKLAQVENEKQLKKLDRIQSLEEQEKQKQRQRKNEKEKKPVLQRLLTDEALDAKKDILEDALKMQAKLKANKNNKKFQKSLKEEVEKLFKDPNMKRDAVHLSHQASQAMSKLKRKDEKRQNSFVIESSEEEALIEDERLADINKLKKEFIAKRSRQSKIQDPRNSTQKELVKDFAEAFTAYVYSKKTEQKQKMDQIKKDLQKIGYKTKQLQTMETSIGQAVKQHYVFALKSDLLNFFFASAAKRREDKITAQFEYDERASSLLALKEKGLLKTGLSNVMEKLGIELRRELEGFLFEEATNSFVSTSLGQKTLDEYTEELVKLQKVAVAAGVVINEEHITNRVKQAIEDLGLEQFVPPFAANQTFNFGEGDQRGKKEEEKLYINQQELLEDKLRNLYLSRALNPGLVSGFDLVFKMKKLRNGLIKLGIFTNERDDQLRKEGEFLAQIRLMEQLKDTYREQATLERLSGPSYEIIKKKRAEILRQLRKIGVRMMKHHLKKLQDRINREMYAVIREEFLLAEAALEIRKTAYNSKKYKMFREILDRLREESSIIESSVTGSNNSFEPRQVIEAA